MQENLEDLIVSKRLKVANERISELETEVVKLKKQIAYLEDTFISETPDKIRYAASEA